MAVARTDRILPIFNSRTAVVLTCSGLLSVAAIGLIVSSEDGIGWIYLLGIVQLTPMMVALTRRYFSYMAFVLANHFMTYSFARWNAAVNLSQAAALAPEAIAAIQELIVCTLLMTGTYYAIRTIFFYQPPVRQRFHLFQMSPRAMILLTVYVATFPLISKWIPPALLGIHFSLLSADMLILQTVNCPELKRLSPYLRACTPLSAALYFLETGFLSVAVQWMSIMFITSCLQRKYRNFIAIGIAVLALSILQTVKGDFRAATWGGSLSGAGIADKASYLGDLVALKYTVGSIGIEDEEDETEGSAKSEDGGVASGFERLGDPSLDRVLAMTPSVVPFWGGETYETIPYIMIPRLLWPDKPARSIWNKFGRLYGLIGEDDVQTSVAVSFFAEAYMNFGYFALYAVSVFLGALIAGCERLSVAFLGDRFYFTYIVFLIPLIYPSADLGTIIGTLMTLVGALFLFRPLLMKLAQRDDYT